MKGDFSRLSFDPTKHFSQVLLQQGRVTLDADVNEQGSILLHHLRTLARDLIGPCGGPADSLGFELSVDTTDPKDPRLVIGAGRYYVDGILCESEGCDYAMQPDFTPAPADGKGDGDPVLEWLAQQNPSVKTFWFYLDVWERHITAIEDDDIREVALGGPDTSTRSKVVWQVRALPAESAPTPSENTAARMTELQQQKAHIDQQAAATTDPQAAAELRQKSAQMAQQIEVLQASSTEGLNACRGPLDGLVTISNAQMAARLDPGLQIKDPCTISPDAAYRGAQNQLYRVEIHQGSEGGAPSFKWSRDNGSVATRWLATEGNDLVVGNARGFQAGDWVELSDEANDLLGLPGLLAKLSKVEGDRLSLDPDSYAGTALPDIHALDKPKVRRWDQTENDDIVLADGAIPIDVNAEAPRWMDLEDGVQIQFAPGGSYRSGDWWLIPARVATGSIDWTPVTSADGTPGGELRAPCGIEHHYAPLGFISWSEPGDPGYGGAGYGGNTGGYQFSNCRCQIMPINSCGRISSSLSGGRVSAKLSDAQARDKTTAPGRTAPVRRGRSTRSK